jgi:small subunit ribosomal protein S17
MPKTGNEKCADKNCPIHGNLFYRGRPFIGTVTDVKGYKTATVEWSTLHYIQKYERFESRKTRIKAHNSPCVNAKKGDRVELMETRHLSKTKNCVILKIAGQDIEFIEKEEGLKEAKVKAKEKVEETTAPSAERKHKKMSTEEKSEE